MHVISIVITPLFYPSFTSYFLLLSFFTFNFLFKLPRLLLLFPLWALFLFICYIKLMRFLTFTLVSHQTLLFATYTYQVKGASTAHLMTYSILGKIPSIVNTSLSSRIVIPHVPLCIFPLACIIWSQPTCYWLWQRCLPNRASPKRGPYRILEVDSFPSPPNHTLCNIFNCKPTFLALDELQVGGALVTTLLFSSMCFVFSFICIFCRCCLVCLVSSFSC